GAPMVPRHDQSRKSSSSRETSPVAEADHPASAADRWARFVLKVCESEGDLKTLKQWADFANVSYSSLRESCWLVGVRPRDARDFARVLRAVVKACERGCDPGVLLDVSDRRTLHLLLEKSGIAAP